MKLKILLLLITLLTSNQTLAYSAEYEVQPDRYSLTLTYDKDDKSFYLTEDCINELHCEDRLFELRDMFKSQNAKVTMMSFKPTTNVIPYPFKVTSSYNIDDARYSGTQFCSNKTQCEVLAEAIKHRIPDSVRNSFSYVITQ